MIAGFIENVIDSLELLEIWSIAPSRIFSMVIFLVFAIEQVGPYTLYRTSARRPLPVFAFQYATDGPRRRTSDTR